MNVLNFRREANWPILQASCTVVMKRLSSSRLSTGSRSTTISPSEFLVTISISEGISAFLSLSWGSRSYFLAAVAQTILKEAAAGLSRYVRGVYSRLFPARESVSICYIGAVFRSEPLLDSFQRQIVAALQCPVRAPRFSPVVGALWEALRSDGNSSVPFHLPEAEK